MGNESKASCVSIFFRVASSGDDTEPISGWKPIFLPAARGSSITEMLTFICISSSLSSGEVSPGFLSKNLVSSSIPY